MTQETKDSNKKGVDSIISEEERQLVRESLIHEKEGKLISLTDFKGR